MRFKEYLINEKKRFRFKKPNFKTIKKRLNMWKKVKKKKPKKTKFAFNPPKKFKGKLKKILKKIIKENYRIVNENVDERKQALALLLSVEDIEDIDADGDTVFEIGGEEYLVLTESEADKKVKEYIENSVWVFQTWFILNHINLENLNDKLGFEASYYDEDEASEIEYGDNEKVFFINTGMSLEEWVDEKKGQSADGNDALYNAIDDIDSFVDDALTDAGRGHFLAIYDNVEEKEGNYYIYRLN